MKPIRVQRKRTKGFKLPENTVCVTRGTAYGNPFKVGEIYRIDWEYPCIASGNSTQFVKGELVFIKDNRMAVDYFEKWINVMPFSADEIEFIKRKNLACFCALDKPCHADVLLKIANE